MITVAISDKYQEFIQAELTKRKYNDVNKLVEDLLLEEQRRNIRKDIEAKIIEGLNSPSSPMPSLNDMLAEAHRRVLNK